MNIRHAFLSDLSKIVSIEYACFPPAERAEESDLRQRLAAYPDHFWLLFDGDHLISFINGPVIVGTDLTDELFTDLSLHQEDGDWQIVLSLNTAPDYRCQGYAATLLRRVISDAKEQGRKGLVLTCKEHLIPYYAKFGFVCEGISSSTHGGAVWYQMRLTF